LKTKYKITVARQLQASSHLLNQLIPYIQPPYMAQNPTKETMKTIIPDTEQIKQNAAMN